MATLKQEILYYNDAQGKIRPNAQIFTYDSVATTTPKNTYTNESLAFPNPWPVISDGDGVFPPMWLESGGYRIVWKDENSVQFQERQDINVAETTILSTSDFYFSDLVNAKLGISINGSTINLIVGQIARTAGKVTSTDGLGAEWLVVAAGTGTADDNLFADLDNGLQLQRLFNQVYGRDTDYLQVTNNLSEIATTGTAAQLAARNNLGMDESASGFVSATTVYTRDTGSSSTGFDIDSNLTVSTYESIGPTGSGADYIWTELDILPSDVKFVDLRVKCVAGDASNIAADANAEFRPTGSTDTIDLPTATSNITTNSVSALSSIITYTYLRVAVGTNRSIDSKWSSSGSTTNIDMYLSGFGV